ncbi:hypothetical protein EYF80_051876 [Liparis tanakae]|uniref:Uncharacterized protein n=1 Tax=Liparis tanakae TaxID=230148 RepID=A0A4Z2F9W7_9TELE|nr:hypothetical protein EYF80_051876 [Liparis tanakae]
MTTELAPIDGKPTSSSIHGQNKPRGALPLQHSEALVIGNFTPRPVLSHLKKKEKEDATSSEENKAEYPTPRLFGVVS